FNSFKSMKSFNLSILGKHEYMRSYFLNERHPDQGWAEFGQDTEDYICYRGLSQKEVEKMDQEREASGEKLVSEIFSSFSDTEKETLNKIEPLGNFQVQVDLEIMPGVYLLGYIDDATKDLTYIRDYKTGSKNSCKKYYENDYYQLDLYSAYVRDVTGKLPDIAEVCMIERSGNCFGMVERRDLLEVKNEIWYHERKISDDRIDFVLHDLRRVVKEISDLYKVFLKVNG
ncbi:MAG: hypothetical protein WD512_05050, partial [Candidatus Paceibacterota bacterium]